MLASFSEFKFYQSFRIPVEAVDDLRFMVQVDDEMGRPQYIEDAKLLDISVTGLGFSTLERLSNNTEVSISLQFKKINLPLTGRVVRAFSEFFGDDDDRIIYGIEIDEEKRIFNFLEKFIISFTSERLKDCLIHASLKDRYTNASDGFEIFSLLLSLFKDINKFSEKDGFVDNMLEETVRIMNAQKASIFLINPDSNELEAVSSIGFDKESLKFDYRKGVAGSVFTTGTALNLDVTQGSNRFNGNLDELYGCETRSVICYPIHNRQDKIVGVIEVINKSNQDRFTIFDEKNMKVLALVFSSLFHTYDRISDKSKIRRFSTPFDRQLALIGKAPQIGSLRRSFLKLKDLDSPVLIQGEQGVGKRLYAQIVHTEGQRGLHPFEIVDCSLQDREELKKMLFIGGPDNKIETAMRGTVLFKNIDKLCFEDQIALKKVIQSHSVDGHELTYDPRYMATTAADLGHSVDNGLFDKELFDILSSTYVKIDPLRRRKDDIEALTNYFFKTECKDKGLLFKSFTEDVVAQLKNYDWPGNVFELKKCVERAVLYHPNEHVISSVELNDSATPLIDINHGTRIFGETPHVSNVELPLKDRVALIEREMILAEIKRCSGNKSKAAKEMGISREALRKKMLQSDEILARLEGGSDKIAA